MHAACLNCVKSAAVFQAPAKGTWETCDSGTCPFADEPCYTTELACNEAEAAGVFLSEPQTCLQCVEQARGWQVCDTASCGESKGTYSCSPAPHSSPEHLHKHGKGPCRNDVLSCYDTVAKCEQATKEATAVAKCAAADPKKPCGSVIASSCA